MRHFPAPTSAWEGVDDKCRRAVDSEDSYSQRPTSPLGRPALAILPRLARASALLAGDPIFDWFQNSFGDIAKADLPEGLVSRSIALGCHTLLERARALAAATSPGRQVELRHIIGAALAPDEAALPPSVHRLPPPRGSDTPSAWADARAQFLTLVQHHHQDDRYPEWVRLVFGESIVTPLITDDRSPHTDLLGFLRYASAFASVIADREVRPPLAIGLFGLWGSGKSTMIDMIGDSLEAIAKRASVEESPRFCRGIVRITFNAWHYAETTLWASLFVRILEELSTHLAERQAGTPLPGSPAEKAQERARVRIDLDAAIAKQRLAEQALSEAQGKAIIASAARDEALRSEAEARAIAESAELARAAAVKADVAVAERIRGAVALAGDAATLLVAFGIPAPRVIAGQPGEDLVKQLGATKDKLVAASARIEAIKGPIARLTAVVGWESRTRKSLLFAGAIAAVFAVLLVLLYFLHLPEAIAGTFLTTLASLGWLWTRLGPLWDRLQDALARAPAVINQLGDASEQVEARIKARKDADTIATQKEKAARDEGIKETTKKATEKAKKAAEDAEKAEAEAISARKDLENARVDVVTLESKVAALAPARLLAAFVTSRATSIDYTQHLGLPTRIRRDLEELEAHLVEVAKDPKSPRRVDRIVLFIDDLDRCSSKVVVAVLEAVHILLASDLFVVVVGVDVRWLKRSLQEHFLMRSGDTHFDPEEYLEKIFQVPFWVPSMSTKGREALLNAALPTAATGTSGTGGVAQHGAGQSAGVSPNQTPTGSGSTPPPIIQLPNAEPVTLSKEERAMIVRWGTIAGETPRRLKRFARSYLILRASLPREGREALLSIRDYDSIGRILALGSAAPHIWPLERPSEESDAAVWDRFFGIGTEPPPHGNLRRWVPEIARFGFAEPRVIP
ncbi:P-loop NTPase fold protein [Rhizobium sp. BK313]|uniref:P-loop NTPase fold protein n=1 Tax=Rhizobium sp. BK313 TaxID=2587081 RepID=UPI001FEEE3C7|nr:P-loop NTPase fold protein [Rhizobium sp. BK313]